MTSFIFGYWNKKIFQEYAFKGLLDAKTKTKVSVDFQPPSKRYPYIFFKIQDSNQKKD